MLLKNKEKSDKIQKIFFWTKNMHTNILFKFRVFNAPLSTPGTFKHEKPHFLTLSEQGDYPALKTKLWIFCPLNFNFYCRLSNYSMCSTSWYCYPSNITQVIFLNTVLS